jgi:inner membrane protein
MPSVFSHAAAAAAISLALAPEDTPGRFWPIAIATAVLPDADTALFYLRIPYPTALGHRGFFHSPFLGLLVSLGFMLVFFHDLESFSLRWWCYLLILWLAWTSHGLLDALTNGGRGVAFFSPFSSKRFFSPWTPIQVAPIRIKSFFSSWGLSVFKSELLWIWTPGLILVLLSRLIRSKI